MNFRLRQPKYRASFPFIAVSPSLHVLRKHSRDVGGQGEVGSLMASGMARCFLYMIFARLLHEDAVFGFKESQQIHTRVQLSRGPLQTGWSGRSTEGSVQHLLHGKLCISLSG